MATERSANEKTRSDWWPNRSDVIGLFTGNEGKMPAGCSAGNYGLKSFLFGLGE